MGTRRNKVKANVKTLIEERDRLMREMDALKNKIAGLELAISLIERESGPSVASEVQRGNVKTILLDLLREVGTTGLNAAIAVEIAARRGIRLSRGTAASNLSRMKADKAVTYDGEKYRLAEFMGPKIAAVGAAGGGGILGNLKVS